MNQNLSEIFQKKITRNATIIVAVSGGADSVYLLMQCLKIQKIYPFSVVIAHLNHGLRKKESDKDALFVKKLAEKNKLAFEYLKLDLKNTKGNLEEIGREKRYKFFEKVRKKYKAEWILTAHHLNDTIETALFNLIRGSSLTGIKGMQIETPSKHLLRPLLNIAKKDILLFMKKNNIKFCKDKTNNDLRFSRNFLRKKVIPLFKKINKKFDHTFAKNLQNFTEISQFLDKITSDWFLRNVDKNSFQLEFFLKEMPFIQKNILAKMYTNIYGNTQQLTMGQLEEILKVFNQKKANRKKEFGPKHFLKITRGNKKTHRVSVT